MANYRGMDGFLSLGGAITGVANPRVTAALSAGASSLSVGAATSLKGVLVAGDRFTIGGEAGSPVHTVTGGPFYPDNQANVIGPISFTPVIAAGGTLINATFNLVSNSVGETKVWGLTTGAEVLEDTAMGDPWRTFVGGVAQWSGQGVVWLDYGDANQKILIDKIAAASPAPAITGVIFGVAANQKQFYAGALISGFQAQAQLGSMVEATYQFQGSGAMLPNWG